MRYGANVARAANHRRAGGSDDGALRAPPAWQPFLSTNIDEVETYLRSQGPLCWDVLYERRYNLCPALMGRRIGRLLLRRIHAGASRALRGSFERNRDQGAYFCLAFLTGGRELLDTGNARIVLQPGDIATWHSSQSLSFESSGTMDKLSLYVPEECIEWMVPHPASYAGLHLKHDSGPGTLLAAYLNCLCNNFAAQDERTEVEVQEMTLALVGAAIAAHGPADGNSPRTALFERIVAFIDRNLENSALKPSQIADAAGISLRYLHLIFAERGQTVAGWIRARRLARCRAELSKPYFTVTEIAFRWGFSDAAQFSHAFKAQYGLSPRLFRQANGATGEGDTRGNCMD